MGFPQAELRFAEDLFKAVLLQEHHKRFGVFVEGVEVLRLKEQVGHEVP
jgi:hypothetical protein